MEAVIAFVVTLAVALTIAKVVAPKKTVINRRLSPDEIKELYYEYLISEKANESDHKLQHELDSFCSWIDSVTKE